MLAYIAAEDSIMGILTEAEWLHFFLFENRFTAF
jgi:hypothetical protein